MAKRNYKEILNKAGLEPYSLCKIEEYDKEYILLHFKTGAFIEGNFKRNLQESLTDLIKVVEEYKRRLDE